MRADLCGHEVDEDALASRQVFAACEADVVTTVAGRVLWQAWRQRAGAKRITYQVAGHLGNALAVDLITVTFPGGGSVSYPGPIAVDQRVWLFENSTVPVSSWGKP